MVCAGSVGLRAAGGYETDIVYIAVSVVVVGAPVDFKRGAGFAHELSYSVILAG